MEIKYFIGIDVSKETLDITLLNQKGQQLVYKHIRNVQKEIAALINELKKSYDVETGSSVFCMEYTGIYNLHLIRYLSDKKANIWMESGVQIKLSMGAVRGKDDKIDSSRIAMYAFDNRHKMKLWKAPREIISLIGDLITHRALLIKQKMSLSVACKEKSGFKSKESMKSIKTSTDNLVKGLNKEIEKIEKQIIASITKDEKLAKLYDIMLSVKGVGFVSAVYIIVATNEFLNINDPKKFGCYCGVVPFEHKSGTSIRGKARVSHMANKDLKTLLHLCATSAIQGKGEIRDYYQRKVAEGKAKMLVLNAVRNKIIQRIFACVNQNRKYENNYQHSLA
jgi:transposase